MTEPPRDFPSAPEVVGSIPLDLEIIVSIAYRFRKAQFAEPRGFIERFRVRTPDEMASAVAEVEAAMWSGTLQSIHEAQRGTA
jgi:hypothetical protein